MRKANLVILASGIGANLQAILDGISSGGLAACISAVISNKSEAGALKRARATSIPAVEFPRTGRFDRDTYDLQLAEIVHSFHPDWVVLAGWGQALSNTFLDCFPKRVIHLHPALPGMFPGRHPIERAFEAFQERRIQKTGIMVHFVPAAGKDQGVVLAQVDIPIRQEDTLEQLKTRIHKVERRILVQAIHNLASLP